MIWCECCAFPIVAGIPVLRADDTSRARDARARGRAQRGRAVHAARPRRRAGRVVPGAARRDGALTYRDALAVLSPDPEGTYFVYRFSDPTFVMAEAVLAALGQEPVGLSGPRARPLRRLRAPDPRARADAAGPTPWCSPTCSSGSCGWRARSRRLTRCRCAATPTSRCPSPADTFPTVVLSDAFPYIWQKRLLAEEMMRQAGRARHDRDAAPAQLARLELLGRHDADAAVLRQPVRGPAAAALSRRGAVPPGRGRSRARSGTAGLAGGAGQHELVHADCEPPGEISSAAICRRRLAPSPDRWRSTRSTVSRTTDPARCSR